MMGWSQRMSYPDDAVEPFIITSGQLMGSLLSCPHLRAMNSVTLWEALEEWLQGPAVKLGELGSEHIGGVGSSSITKYIPSDP